MPVAAKQSFLMRDEKGGILKLSKGKRPPPCSGSNKATQYLKWEPTLQYGNAAS